MDRRNFFRISAAALLPLMACERTQQGKVVEKKWLNTVFLSDMARGHRVLNPQADAMPPQQMQAEVLIVGGGIAGLSAAWGLRQRDFVLCELSDSLGGSSGGANFGDTVFSQGAHYDIPYPNYYGQDVLRFFEEIGVIGYNTLADRWDFTDQKYMIRPEDEAMAYIRGDFYQGVLLNAYGLDKLFAEADSLRGQLLLPSRLMSPDLQALNQVSFFDWLRQNIQPAPILLDGIDYQMMDDWGGTSKEISALAGLFYYGGRPEFPEEPGIFSPPEGNAYFVNKIGAQLPEERLLTQHLIRKITPQKDGGFEVLADDLAQGILKRFRVRQVVYAGQKHALPYVFPDENPGIFAKNRYVPWVVLNYVLKPHTKLPTGKWQNEMISADRPFLGFVDSASQYQAPHERRVLTAYYCFTAEERFIVAELAENQQSLAIRTLGHLAVLLNTPYHEIFDQVEQVFIKVMGHAMPLPAPGHLFYDGNNFRKYPGLTYAGVDNGRLPLLMEAADSGLVAAQLLNRLS